MRWTRSKYLPYAGTPGRLVVQLVSDLVVAAWTALWVLVGLAVHEAVSTIAEAGRQLDSGAAGVAGHLGSAGESADRIPLVGDVMSRPLEAAIELRARGISARKPAPSVR